ncbi:MAG: long-chain fatty acid--CoA ligase [Acidobacteria bacterium]|nr:MAG: long-chain fatty acid--CoA ligase [Acidobacteriota bacterium]
MHPRTLPRLFEASVEQYGQSLLMSEKTGDAYAGSTYRQIREEVYQFGAGLMAYGVAKGDRVALLSEGRKDWLVAELGIFYAGAVCVPLSVKIEAVGELCFRLSHSGTRMLIVSATQVPKALAVKQSMPDLQLLVLDEVRDDDLECANRQEVMAAGARYLDENRAAFVDRWQGLVESDPATISYTSGTTANPKGIILTHRNYTTNVEQCSRILEIPPTYRSLLILPWDHSFAHTAGLYLLIASGASMGAVQVGRTYAETLRNIPANIREFKPTFLFSVPALARNFRKNIENGVKQKGRTTEALFNAGLRVAYAYNLDGLNRGKGFRSLLKPIVSLFDVLIFNKIRQAFGGELKFFIGGGALLDIELQRFFYALGIPMLQGYGLTEAAPVISANVPARHKLGSSGRLVPDLDLRVCDEQGAALAPGRIGEIVVRGENVMAGYWDNQAATEEVLRDGWLRTGDLGFLDADGFLHVLGRRKSLLISNDGEKFSPEGIEEAITSASRFVDQIMLYNNQSPYTVALLVPNKSAIRDWIRHEGLSVETAEAQSRVLELLKTEIDEYREGGSQEGLFPSKWLPAAFAVLEEGFTEQNQMVNATLKMVRGRIAERHRDTFAYLFTPEGKRVDNPRNRKVIAGL